MKRLSILCLIVLAGCATVPKEPRLKPSWCDGITPELEADASNVYFVGQSSKCSTKKEAKERALKAAHNMIGGYVVEGGSRSAADLRKKSKVVDTYMEEGRFKTGEKYWICWLLLRVPR